MSIDGCQGETAGTGANLKWRQLAGLVFGDGFQFNGKTVTVPTGDVVYGCGGGEAVTFEENVL